MSRRFAILAAATLLLGARIARATDEVEPLPPGWQLSEGEARSNEDGVLRLIRARYVSTNKGEPERGCDVYISRADGSQPQTQALAKAETFNVFILHVTFRNGHCILRNAKESAKSGIRLILSEIPLP
jgi:hypothetical protein